MILKIKLKQLDHAKGLNIPKYETPGSAGMDLCAANKKDITINKNEYKLIPTGLIIALPKNYEAQIRPRSGLALKYGVTVLKGGRELPFARTKNKFSHYPKYTAGFLPDNNKYVFGLFSF